MQATAPYPGDEAAQRQAATAAESEEEYKPRVHDEPFTTSQEEEEELPRRGLPLMELTKSTDPVRLEAGVRAGVRMLLELELPLKELTGNADAESWLQQVESVRALAVKNRTVVGVVGNTGAGKSSVINAMLEEERLVPTNCMRACTAVVTEMSYNDSTNPAAKYRAEIEFIKPEDWQRELKILFVSISSQARRNLKDLH